MGVVRVEDVGAVSWGVHPGTFNDGRRHITECDILSNSLPVRDTEAFETIPGLLTFGVDVRKESADAHIFRVESGDSDERDTAEQGLEAVINPIIIHEFKDGGFIWRVSTVSIIGFWVNTRGSCCGASIAPGGGNIVSENNIITSDRGVVEFTVGGVFISASQRDA